ncbi:MAG TPA: hypothetical protein VKU37_06680 [Verrucomicrobiae bacterium]|nr:hypothetical protein [Verrucomicrobiae bacterium]
MKKIILSTLIIVGLNFIAHSQVLMNQGVIAFDDSVGSPNVYINGVLDTSTDINAELLYSTSGPFGAYQPVVTLLLSDTTPIYGTFHYGVVEPAAGDVSIFATGQLYDISGNTYQDPANPPGTVENFIVEGWLGNYSSYSGTVCGSRRWHNRALYGNVVRPGQPDHCQPFQYADFRYNNSGAGYVGTGRSRSGLIAGGSSP